MIGMMRPGYIDWIIYEMLSPKKPDNTSGCHFKVKRPLMTIANSQRWWYYYRVWKKKRKFPRPVFLVKRSTFIYIFRVFPTHRFVSWWGKKIFPKRAGGQGKLKCNQQTLDLFLVFFVLFASLVSFFYT